MKQHHLFVTFGIVQHFKGYIESRTTCKSETRSKHIIWSITPSNEGRDLKQLTPCPFITYDHYNIPIRVGYVPDPIIDSSSTTNVYNRQMIRRLPAFWGDLLQHDGKVGHNKAKETNMLSIRHDWTNQDPIFGSWKVYHQQFFKRALDDTDV